MSNNIRAPFPWFGGKGNPKIKKAILELLPPHDYYVEPFGGGASILMAKTPAKVETYNDVNRAIVNFFRVIADPEYFGKFMARAALLPLSRELYEEFFEDLAGDPRSGGTGGQVVLCRKAEFRRDIWSSMGGRNYNDRQPLAIKFR